jgi:hypothetical protein
MKIMALTVGKMFTKIDNNVIKDTRLSSNAFKMYSVMQSFPIGKHASNPYFMKVLGCSEATVSRTRKELINAGYLEVQKISRREYQAFLGNSQISGLEVKRRYYKDELHSTKE